MVLVVGSVALSIFFYVTFAERINKKRFIHYIQLIANQVKEEELMWFVKRRQEESIYANEDASVLFSLALGDVLHNRAHHHAHPDLDSDSSSSSSDSDSSSNSSSSDSDSDSDSEANSNANSSAHSDEENEFMNAQERDVVRQLVAQMRMMQEEDLDPEELVEQLEQLQLQSMILNSLMEERQRQRNNANDVVIEEVESDDSAPSINSVDWTVFHKHNNQSSSLQRDRACSRPYTKRQEARASPTRSPADSSPRPPSTRSRPQSRSSLNHARRGWGSPTPLRPCRRGDTPSFGPRPPRSSTDEQSRHTRDQ